MLAGAYVHGDAKEGSTAQDFDAWGVGTQIGWRGFKLGGSYNDNGDSQIETEELEPNHGTSASPMKPTTGVSPPSTRRSM